MAIKFKRKLVGKDGGKHPHLKGAQDYSVAQTAQQWSTARIARYNLDTALSLLQSKPVIETLGHHPTLECARREVLALMGVLVE